MDSEQSINIHQFSQEIGGVEVARYSVEDMASWLLLRFVLVKEHCASQACPILVQNVPFSTRRSIINQTAKEAMVNAALQQAEEAGLICGMNRDHAKIIVTFEKRIHSKPSGA